MKTKPKLKPKKEPEMTRGELIAFLCDIIRTPVGHIDENHALAQEVRREESQRGNADAVVTRATVKMPGKLEAVRQLVELNGWKAPERTDNNITVQIRHF